MRNRIKRKLLAKMGPKDLDRKSIKEEYVEPDFGESPLNVKRKPIKIKTERVAIKEEIDFPVFLDSGFDDGTSTKQLCKAESCATRVRSIFTFYSNDLNKVKIQQ